MAKKIKNTIPGAPQVDRQTPRTTFGDRQPQPTTPPPKPETDAKAEKKEDDA